MDLLQKEALILIKSALTGEPCTLSEPPDVKELTRLATKHRIGALMYYGLVESGYAGHPQVKRLFLDCCRYVSVSEGQMRILSKVFASFEEKGIEYLPLKGVLLKNIYPKPEMRRMGDADVLIRRQQYDAIKEVLSALEFTYEYETDHEIVWKHPNLLLELHKRLVPRRDKDFYRYFGNGWSHAIREEDHPCRYRFSPEIQFVSLFVHLVKHYRSGGIGLSHMIDLWVYRRYHPELDEALIEGELSKVYLNEFYENVRDTLRVWFDGEEPTEMTNFITNVIFSSGVYGEREQRHLSYVAKARKREPHYSNSLVAKWLWSVFPSVRMLKTKYPILKRHAWLLPGVWVVRWFDVLLFHRGRISERSRDMKEITDEKLNEFEQALHYVGLEYHFDEE